MTKMDEFKHSLNLVIHLTNAADGRPIRNHRAVFLREKERFSPVYKDTGVYVMIDGEPGYFLLTAAVPGYFSQTVPVLGGSSNGELLVAELPLIPQDNDPVNSGFHTLEGVKKGIQIVEGVEYGNWELRVKKADREEGVLTLHNPHKIMLSEARFGLIDTEKETFEPFMIAGQKNAEEIRVKVSGKDAFFEKEVKPGSPVKRIIPGMVWEEGRFIWKARGSRETDRYLLRYFSAGGEQFEKMEFCGKGGM